ncbi:MAG TPA: inositol monophosphatase family protein, partial [Candidatus Hydrogenedentes bacterium]|nr:inositol monophosphatase family protein [Candidatus Hydrogenedentota bacterium]
MGYERELELSLDIVRRAGDLALRYYGQPTMAEEKEDASPVTVADRECEKFISRAIQENFPRDGILGEEGVSVPARSGRRWLIDPIDGTRDFVRQNPYWAVQLALEVGRTVEMGIIFCPCTDEMLFAAGGHGCYWNNTRVSASPVAPTRCSAALTACVPAFIADQSHSSKSSSGSSRARSASSFAIFSRCDPTFTATPLRSGTPVRPRARRPRPRP